MASTFQQVGNEVEYVSLLGHSLKLYKDTTQAKLDGERWGMNIHHTYHGEYLHSDTDTDSSDSPIIHIRDPAGNELTLDFNY